MIDRHSDSSIDAAGGSPELGELWRRWARRASDSQLAAIAGVSLALVAAYGIVIAMDARLALRWWPPMVVPIFSGAFGVWAIADRELGERESRADAATPSASESGAHRRHGALIALKLAAGATAGLAVAAAAMEFLRLTVGTWIS
ncbi:MAG: hypothetical protein ACHQWU_10050 [Gemmatimonadales bacterium]